MEQKPKRTRFSPEVRARAVGMVQDHLGDHPSEWAAISSIASKIGCTAETLRNWIRRDQRDTGRRPGPTTEEQARIKALERENRELRQANEILRKASAYFAMAELDRRSKPRSRSSTNTVGNTGSSRSAGCCRSPRRPTGGMSPNGPIPRRRRRGPATTPGSAVKSTGCGGRISGFTVFGRSGDSSTVKGFRYRDAPWSG